MVLFNLPALFINFKTYIEASGKKALELALIAETASKNLNIPIILVVQAPDLRLISEKVSLPVFAQHIDPITSGGHTGHILPETVSLAGASGTILNHAENKRENSFLEQAITRAHETNLKVMLCAESSERAREFALFKNKPDLIAIEPPELIGGNVSVSSANPRIITDTITKVNSVTKIPVITGAGIKTTEDVRKALLLGSKGVFVASGIVKSKDPKSSLLDLLKGFVI